MEINNETLQQNPALAFLKELYDRLYPHRFGDSSWGQTFYVMYNEDLSIGEKMHEILTEAGIEHEYQSIKESYGEETEEEK
jgi:hypothetical protein